MKRYAVKEVYPTIQGEGANTGRPAVFVRFAGCNLWSGTQAGRHAPACARWCDTDFVGTDGPNGGRYTADELAQVIRREWPGHGRPFVVLTGGEPTLQWDLELATATRDMERAMETNGTRLTPLHGLEWVTVSPKGDHPLARTRGDELKLVYPQPEVGAQPAVFEHRTDLRFGRWYLQPLWLPDPDQRDANVAATVAYVQEHPCWRLSVQTHKTVGVR